MNRRYLKQRYDFHCMCTYCTLPDEESKASDIRLTTMSDLYKHLSLWGHGTIDGQEAIQIVKQIWAVGGEEGYTSERGRLAADAMIVAAAHSEYVPHVMSQVKATSLKRVQCRGSDGMGESSARMGIL
jgi:hypothetical protein